MKVILISVDSLRYDASRILWPYFNIVFTQHYVSNNWTLPVIARMLTGQMDTGLNYYKKMWSENIYQKLENKLKQPTVAKYLKDKSWITFGNTEGVFVRASFGFGNPKEWTLWVQNNKGDGSKLREPLFTDNKNEFRFYHEYYLHNYLRDIKNMKVDTKLIPGTKGAEIKVYSWPNPDDKGLLEWEACYWRRAANLYNFLSWVPKSKAIVILTADHGESFYEYYDNISHAGAHMTEEIAHVPLLIHWPGKGLKRIDQFTRDIDITPTILDIAGIKAKLDGTSLLPMIKNRKKVYGRTMTDKYVHRNDELWEYYFSPTEKAIRFVKKI